MQRVCGSVSLTQLLPCPQVPLLNLLAASPHTVSDRTDTCPPRGQYLRKHSAYHCLSHPCTQTDRNRTPVEKHESSIFSSTSMLSFSVATLDHFQHIFTQRWQSWLWQTALAWSAASGLACWATLAWGWGASASSPWQHWQWSCWRWEEVAAWRVGNTAGGKPCAPGCSPRWLILHRKSSPASPPAEDPAGSRPASGAAGLPCSPEGSRGAYWRRRHGRPAGAADRSDRSCGGLSQSTPAPRRPPTGWSRSRDQVGWCHYQSSEGKEKKKGD